MEAPERVPEENVVLNDVAVRGESCRIKLAVPALAPAVRRHGSPRRAKEEVEEKQEARSKGVRDEKEEELFLVFLVSMLNENDGEEYDQ